jgi:hypothetical protein
MSGKAGVRGSLVVNELHYKPEGFIAIYEPIV